MAIRFWQVGMASIASIGLGSTLAIAAPASKTAQKQATRAELRYQVNEENKFLTDFNIKIQRQGRTLLDAKLPLEQLPNYTPDEFVAIDADVQVMDFDADGEPEVIVDVNQAGAHCCAFSVIYGYNQSKQQYQAITHFWGNYTSGYWMEGLTGKAGDRNLPDLNRDGKLEFVAIDDRFRGEFGGFAVSAAPVQIWRYQTGKLVDVTQEFPVQVRGSARAIWKQYESIRREINPEAAKGAMAAYVGAKTLLGEHDDAMKRLRVGYPNDRAFSNEVRQFLRKTGYLR